MITIHNNDEFRVYTITILMNTLGDLNTLSQNLGGGYNGLKYRF